MGPGTGAEQVFAQRPSRPELGPAHPDEHRLRRTGQERAASGDDKMEVWHYRKELLPKKVPYQQVDFQFVSKQGYGANTLQRETDSVNTLEAAETAAKTN